MATQTPPAPPAPPAAAGAGAPAGAQASGYNADQYDAKMNE